MYNIEVIPLVNLFVATDSQRRLRLSADIIAMYGLDSGNRVALGYDHSAKVIALRLADNGADPTAANVDKRGYVSAAQFYRKTRIPQEARRYVFVSEQDGWLLFSAEDSGVSGASNPSLPAV
ncbi:hypothetical protein [Paenibacillus dakarensis]|uniref:hypothetical protein n=1 Tax=Paenibacillus dakarensis TaxID=1527293 RepID=UPI0006D54136|nr:hypothetical protein [Paenibacillus dakarensis]